MAVVRSPDRSHHIREVYHHHHYDGCGVCDAYLLCGSAVFGDTVSLLCGEELSTQHVCAVQVRVHRVGVYAV